MPGSISQMQMLYNPEEDRILFRVNSTDNKEFRFWLTRRFSMLLLKVLRDHLEKDPDISLQETPEARRAVKEFKQEQAVRSANFKEKFQEKDPDFPLGSDSLLAFKLNFNIKDNVLNLGIQPKSGQGITIGINQQINTSMTQLMLAASKKAGWNLENIYSDLGIKGEEQRVIN